MIYEDIYKMVEEATSSQATESHQGMTQVNSYLRGRKVLIYFFKGHSTGATSTGP